MGLNGNVGILFMSLVLFAFTTKAYGKPAADDELAAGGSKPVGDFDVCAKYGAKPDSDITLMLAQAWKEACSATSPSRIIIPKGDYMLGEIRLEGPCTSHIEVQIDGSLKAPPELEAFKEPNWVTFEDIDGLTVSGTGSLDGQGPLAWTQNHCDKNPDCKQFPINLRFNKIRRGLVKGITSINSKFFHVNLMLCDDITFQHFNIKAPHDSINTDGIHMGRSKNVEITDSIIGTGDDCISIGHGSINVSISRVKCGPGHSISIGSLGREPNEQLLEGIFVRECTFTNTDNGVRIKSWPGSRPGSVSNVVFEDMVMNNVSNPVIIDQGYCPHNQCSKGNKASQTKLNNVAIRNVKGTSATPEAVQVMCGAGTCTNFELSDIDLKYQGSVMVNYTSICENVKPKVIGILNPEGPTCA